MTELAEMGVADHVLESTSGHLSRRMLEHYSQIRIDGNGRRSMPSMPPGARQRIRAMAMGMAQTRRRSRRSRRSATTSRHSHVRGWFCADSTCTERWPRG
ncbi:hypothetical protein [Luteitalea pratensis]|uniref:hypothetical protein n=1 Tax=Luteitalea pratensis TaxID=1855912 RepID=UPI003AAC165A